MCVRVRARAECGSGETHQPVAQALLVDASCGGEADGGDARAVRRRQQRLGAAREGARGRGLGRRRQRAAAAAARQRVNLKHVAQVHHAPLRAHDGRGGVDAAKHRLHVSKLSLALRQ